jgi:hypothetical protein
LGAGLAHDPTTYEPLARYVVVDANRASWDGGATNPLPSVSITKNVPRVAMHPGEGSLTVVGWRSPVSGVVQVRGLFEHAGQTCGAGVGWAIDVWTTTLASGVLQTRASMGFALSSGQRKSAL